MTEHTPKLRQSASPPVARSGAGDISERELSRERYTLQTTPQPRVRVHPKKQLFSVPINKFTAKSSAPSPNLKRIKSCLEELHNTTPARPTKIVPKAVSMEDLTPTKRLKTDKDEKLPLRRWSGLHGAAEQHAATVITHFMVVSAWRRRRDEVKCLRRTLEAQVSCSERLRVQVYALKSLLDSDNAKVRLAMRELERLKQLLKEKEAEKAVLEREKTALEGDVSAAEDKASEMSIGWRNCRNELEGVKAATAALEAAVRQQRAAAAEARAQRDRALLQARELEQCLSERGARLAATAERAAALTADGERARAQLRDARAQLQDERAARARLSAEGAALSARVAEGAAAAAALRGALARLQAEVARLDAQLADTRRQLAWWPAPLTRLVGAARAWCGRASLADALLWSALPPRQGC